MNISEWDALADLDYSKPDDVATSTKKQQWKANPITDTENTEAFLRFLSTRMKADMTKIDNWKEALQDMRVADKEMTDRDAAISAVGFKHRDKLIEFAVANSLDLPSAQYLTTRLKPTGEKNA